MTRRLHSATVLPLLIVVGGLLSACGPRALGPDEPIVCDNCDRWNEAQDPFRIHGNTWYVGTRGLTSLLIESDDGLILIDGGLPQSAELIDANIRSLGFDTLDVKAILLSHPHYDHAGGLAALQRFTGAKPHHHMSCARCDQENANTVETKDRWILSEERFVG